MPPTQDLAVLGLLMEAPLHGYELKHRLEERMRHVVRIAPGTVYYTLKKLSQQGYVESARERAGNRPEREVFRITALGRARFAALAEEAIALDERATWAFDVALYFFPLIERGRFVEAVATNRARVTAFRRDVDELARAFPGKWPLHLEALRRKGEILGDALAAWYDELAVLLDEGARAGEREGGAPRRRAEDVKRRPLGDEEPRTSAQGTRTPAKVRDDGGRASAGDDAKRDRPARVTRQSAPRGGRAKRPVKRARTGQKERP